MGLLLNQLEKYFNSRSKRLSISVGCVALTVAVSSAEFTIGGVYCGFSLLLVCMMMSTVFCNICDFSEELMSRVDGWPRRCLCCFWSSAVRSI